MVSEGNFSEMYSFTDSKKYFYDYFSFDKKALLSVKAKVEVGYDLSKLELQVDGETKQIIINKIPQEEISVIPDVKYFDLQESQFNSFSKDELNELNKKAVDNIKGSIMYTELQQKAKQRLFEELSKVYQLSKVYDWKVVDNTESNLLEQSGFITSYHPFGKKKKSKLFRLTPVSSSRLICALFIFFFESDVLNPNKAIRIT